MAQTCNFEVPLTQSIKSEVEEETHDVTNFLLKVVFNVLFLNNKASVYQDKQMCECSICEPSSGSDSSCAHWAFAE